MTRQDAAVLLSPGLFENGEHGSERIRETGELGFRSTLFEYPFAYHGNILRGFRCLVKYC